MSETRMQELARRYAEDSKEILRLEDEQLDLVEQAVNFANFRINVELPETGCHLAELPDYGTFSPFDADWHAQRAISDLAQAVIEFNFAVMNQDEGFLSGVRPNLSYKTDFTPGVAWQDAVGAESCWDYYCFSGGEYGDQVFLPCWLLDWEPSDAAAAVENRRRAAELE